MLPPRPLLAACLVLVGLLSWSVAARPPPQVPLGEAARWEGQSVRLEAWVTDAQGDRLSLADGGHVLQADAPGLDPRPGIGDRVLVQGRLTRWQGYLRLDLETLQVVAGPEPIQPSWHDLSHEPSEWVGTLLRLRGAIDHGRLVGDEVELALGHGHWPTSGSVQATGLLRFDPACVCHRLDAREVRAWTP